MKRIRQRFPHFLDISFREADAFSTDDKLLEHLKTSVGFWPALTFIHTAHSVYEQVVAMSTRGVVSPTSSVKSHTHQVLECVTEALLDVRRAKKRVDEASAAAAAALAPPLRRSQPHAGEEALSTAHTQQRFFSTRTDAHGTGHTADPSVIAGGGAAAGGAGGGSPGLPRPLIVLNGFDTVFVRDHEEFAQQLIHWARAVSAAQLATVVILCDVNVAQEVEDAPDVTAAHRPEVILLEDAGRRHSIDLLRGELTNVTASPAAFVRAADTLGGRLSDLRSLVVRIKTTAALREEHCHSHQRHTNSRAVSGGARHNDGGSSSGSSGSSSGEHTPCAVPIGDRDIDEALEFVVAGAVAFLRTTALGLGSSSELEWTRAQAWYVLRRLHDSQAATATGDNGTGGGSSSSSGGDGGAGVSYDDLLFSPIFDGSEAPLRAMQRAEIITVRRDRFGRQQACFARPVLCEATRRLVQDPHLLSGLERNMLKQLRDLHYQELQRLEAELSTLDALHDAKHAVSTRRSSIEKQIANHSRYIDHLDSEMEHVLALRHKWE